MNKLINIHRNLFTVIKNNYKKQNLNHLTISKKDDTNEIIKKIDILSLVISNPQEYSILKYKSQ